MRLTPRDYPCCMELSSLRVAPGPPHPRGGRRSFYSSYSSSFEGIDSLCSFNSSQLLDDSDGRKVNVDDVVPTRFTATTRCCRCPQSRSSGWCPPSALSRVLGRRTRHYGMDEDQATNRFSFPRTTDDLITEAKRAFEETQQDIPECSSRDGQIMKCGGSNTTRIDYFALVRSRYHCHVMFTCF
ncbi:hypothetical protein PR002_g21108 [Phytophthora rubi]|uniref:Uncharacterized protein n=1 Tax=Phytophthora rubi TaxID=129364 RepID=A0A6A3J7S8_9STRA|nr:hypothetical protein PR002_g21108 [Phytophthora rubi]